MRFKKLSSNEFRAFTQKLSPNNLLGFENLGSRGLFFQPNWIHYRQCYLFLSPITYYSKNRQYFLNMNPPPPLLEIF